MPQQKDVRPPGVVQRLATAPRARSVSARSAASSRMAGAGERTGPTPARPSVFTRRAARRRAPRPASSRPARPAARRTSASPSRCAAVRGSAGSSSGRTASARRAGVGLLLEDLGHDLALGHQVHQADPLHRAQPLEQPVGQRVHLVGDHHRACRRARPRASSSPTWRAPRRPRRAPHRITPQDRRAARDRGSSPSAVARHQDAVAAALAQQLRSAGVAERRPQPPRSPAPGSRERCPARAASGGDPEPARGPPSRVGQRAAIDQRMTDVFAPEAEPAEERLLERQDHREPVHRGREPSRPAWPPGPELRRDVVQHLGAGRLAPPRPPGRESRDSRSG